MTLGQRLKPLFYFSLVFIAFTVIGTLSHEMGHIVVAKVLGYETTLHYASMNWEGESPYHLLPSNAFWISLGGPTQTLLTALVGVSILLFREMKLGKRTWNFIDWLAAFLTLFCLRQLANLFVGMVKFFLGKVQSPFGGDEFYLAQELNWHPGLTSITTACLSLIISLVVIFRFIPAHFRLSFISGGFIGGILGYYLWLIKIGPWLLP